MSCRSRARVDLASLPGAMVSEPQLRVLRQRDGAVHLLRQALALPLEQDRLLIEPFLLLLGRQSLRRMDSLLFGLDAIPLVVVTHGDHQQVAAAPFSNTCHVVLTSLSLASFQLRPVLQTQHTASGEAKLLKLSEKPIFYESNNHPACWCSRESSILLCFTGRYNKRFL